MAKTKISEFDIDPANNTDINSINIAEGCAPSGINNAIRQLMSDLKEFQTGAGGDPFNGAVNGTVGATTPNTGAFTTLSASGAFSANGGATLGDASGDALTINSSAVSIPNGLNFDSNTFVIDATNNRVGIGTASPSTALTVNGTTTSNIFVATGTASTLASNTSGLDSTGLTLNRTGSNYIGLLNGGVGTALLVTSDSTIFKNTANTTEFMRINSTGNVGIGTSSLLGGSKVEIRQNADANYSTTFTTGTTKNELVLRDLSDVGTYSTPFSTLAFAAGSSGAGWATITGIRTSSQNSAIAFGTASGAADTTERMRLDSSGNLGLGVTPSTPYTGTIDFQIGGSTNLFYYGSASYLGNNCYLKTGTGADTYIGSGYATRYDQTATGQHRWNIAASGTAGNAITFTQAMTLDASGRLGIGTTSPADPLHVAASSSGAVVAARIENTNAAASSDAALELMTANGLWEVRAGRTTGALQIFSPGPTERMSIDSSGNLLVGTTSAVSKVTVDGSTGSAGSFTNSSASASYTLLVNNNAGSGTRRYVNFAISGTSTGEIYSTGSTTVYSTSSDYRLKDITGSLTGYKERIMALQPKQGFWKADGLEFRGFLAHEFANQYPMLVGGEKDAVDAEGNPQYQGMQAGGSETIADLVALVKELVAEVDSLKAQLNK